VTRSAARRVVWWAWVVAGTLPVVTVGPPADARPETPSIVNGVPTAGWPAVGLFDADPLLCTGTLIGCRTVLTAAHCICEDPLTGERLDGEACRKRPDLLDPAGKSLFFPTLGRVPVAGIEVHPDYRFLVRSDLALVTLERPVVGIAPARVNTLERPFSGTPGTIVGFGSQGGEDRRTGIELEGRVRTAPCQVVPGSTHLCWTFDVPVGEPGADSNTCLGDSGGPLFVDLGSGLVLAGVTSGGFSADCMPPDIAFDADVYLDRGWIARRAKEGLDVEACGTVPQAGSPGAPSSSTVASLEGAEAVQAIEVEEGVYELSVGLSTLGWPEVDYDLLVRRAGAGEAACESRGRGGVEFCRVTAPSPGSWEAVVRRSGEAPDSLFQVTTTRASMPIDRSPCVADGTTLCLDDQPGDGRFEVRATYGTVLGGGSSGEARAVDVRDEGITSGGVLWFFTSDNPEILVKVLNACSFTGYYWVFYSATTNVGFTLTVRDTVTGRRWVSANPDTAPALPVLDGKGFSCVP
jgi:hypothetical protein